MWTASLITAQFTGVIVFIFDIIAGQCKTQHKILLYSTLAYLVDVVSFLLLSATTGIAFAVYNFIRCLVFFAYSARNKKPDLVLLIGCFIFISANGFFTYENRYSILVIIASYVATYALWQTKAMITRILFLISDSLWVAYCFSVFSYATGGLLIVENILLLYALYRYDIKTKYHFFRKESK